MTQLQREQLNHEFEREFQVVKQQIMLDNPEMFEFVAYIRAMTTLLKIERERRHLEFQG